MHRLGNLLRFLTVAAGVLLGSLTAAQETTLAELLADPTVDLARPIDRSRVVERMAAIEASRRTAVHARAARVGLPIRTVFPNGRVQELADFDADGLPLYLATDNANAAISTGVNLLRTSPYSLTGSGVVIGLWDGGSALTSHVEFGGRVTVKDGAVVGDHATHVGGTLIASGVSASARGMATAATVDSYEWTNDVSEMTSRGASGPAQAGKIYLSNHSYNYISGWNDVNGGTPTRRWEWNGSGTTSTSVEDDFGRYNTYARDSDSLAFSAPYYLIFRSAGNDRGDSPVSGETVALSPGSSTVVAYNPAIHPAGDASYRGGYETIGFNALAKNVITVGSVGDAVSGGTRNPAIASMSSFSSWGPTDDGRIKPDVVANGDYLYSSLGYGNSAYGNYSGTSMATPNACGSAALLIQAYSNLFPNQAMRSSTLKGLLIHTADDLGTSGPDYQFGWGLVNAKAAADVLRDHQAVPTKQRITEAQLTTSTPSRTLSFLWDGSSPIIATLCWTDPAGTATTTADSRTRRLVNDLNLKIIGPSGTVYSPFVMPFVGTWTQAAMAQAATTGVNTTDNVEQVRLAAPAVAGTYQAVVSYTGTLTNSSQTYSLLLSGTSAEPPPPPPLALSSVSPASGLSLGSTSLTLVGTGLRADTAIRLTRSGQADIVATAHQLVGENLTCQVDLTGAEPGAWDVVASNPNLETSTLAGAFTVVGAVWAERFDASVTGWTSQTVKGTNSWNLVTTKSQTPTKSYFAPGPNRTSTTYLNSPAIAIPAGVTNLQLKFWQNYNLESRKDGGRLEFSINNGAWFDVLATDSGASFASNGYNNTINSTTNDFPKLQVWTGNSGTFVETIVNFTDNLKYAGKTLRMRWGLATNNSVSSTGWYIDSIALVGGGNLTNQPPTITSAASSSSTESVTDPDSTVYQIIRGNSTNLSVTAEDDAEASALTYTWSVISGPASPVTFAENATATAHHTVVEFSAAGDYLFGVTARDAQGLVGTSEVNLRVVQTANGLVISPLTATLMVGAAQPFSATVVDQFSSPLVPQPAALDWSTSGGGVISANGVYAANHAGGPYTITASTGDFSQSATVTVSPAPASVALSDLAWTYDKTPKSATATTTPAELAVSLTYEGSETPPTAAGTYAVVATITDPNYQGSTSGMLVIEKAPASVALSDLAWTYDKTPKSATATTTPADLAVSLTYEGSETPPTAAGTYAVVATITDPNYQGSANGMLVIEKAVASVALSDLAWTYDKTPKSATATTTPAELAVSLTYEGSETPPTAAGTYAVVAAITDPNYQGSASGMLVIEKAPASVALGDLAWTYDKAPKSATAATTPADLAVSLTYEGSETLPTAAGTYAVVATITDPNYQGSASGMLVIEKAPASVALSDLAWTYDKTPKSATATTTPADLAVSLTYEGSETPPTAAGTYAVVATITDPNYQGSANGVLVIALGNDWLGWTNRHFSETEQAAGLSAELADPDADGLPNLAEYALGGDPRAFTTPLVPALDETGLWLTFKRPKDLPGVTYFAESSADMLTWTTIPLEIVEPGDPETLIAREPLTPGNPQRFLRLRFTLEKQPQ